MAARESGNGCGSSNVWKRKWPGEGCGQEFPGDPPTDGAVTLPDGFLGVIKNPSSVGANKLTFKGVSLKVVVDVKKFNDMPREHFYTTITEPDDVEVRMVVAAIVHDLVRLYGDPEREAKDLNVMSVEKWIRREELPVGCYIGKGLLDKFVLDKCATLPYAPREGWVGLDAKELAQLRGAIKAQGLEFFKILQADIIKELSQGGRLREEENQIPAAIEEDEPPAKDLEKGLDQLNLNEQITSLKATHAAHTAFLKAEIKSLKETKEKDDATITSLMLTTLELPAPEANLKDLYIKELEAALQDSQHQLQEARGGYVFSSYRGPPSPTTGLMI